MFIELHRYYGYGKPIIINTDFIEYVSYGGIDDKKVPLTDIKLNGTPTVITVRESYDYICKICKNFIQFSKKGE